MLERVYSYPFVPAKAGTQITNSEHTRLWIPSMSAFTRVHSPSKTGVNALNDALCPAMTLGRHLQIRQPARLRSTKQAPPARRMLPHSVSAAARVSAPTRTW